MRWQPLFLLSSSVKVFGFRNVLANSLGVTVWKGWYVAPKTTSRYSTSSSEMISKNAQNRMRQQCVNPLESNLANFQLHYFVTANKNNILCLSLSLCCLLIASWAFPIARVAPTKIAARSKRWPWVQILPVWVHFDIFYKIINNKRNTCLSSSW